MQAVRYFKGQSDNKGNGVTSESSGSNIGIAPEPSVKGRATIKK